MNYYIDFDNTLYETAKLTDCMLKAMSNSISKQTGANSENIFKFSKENWDHTNDNIFSYSEKMANKYNADANLVLDEVNKVVLAGEENVFEDAKTFLKKLKNNGNKIFLLTYLPKVNQEYQMKKILGSGITNYFTGLIMTTELKFNIDINYENGIFIDDDPRDLNGLYERNPIKVIRIRKENNWRSKIDINNKNIEEYESFDDIEII